MKKQVPILLLPVLICLGSKITEAQSPRLQLFEYFDNTSIPSFGATTNAHFDSVAAANTNEMTVIKYHVAWGAQTGTDPMNLANPTQAAARVSYYGIMTDPTGYQDGGDTSNPTFNGAQPDTFSQSYINKRDTVTSPFTITVSHHLNAAGDSILTHTVVAKTGDITGIATIYVVVTEKLIHFATAPGFSGDTYFRNVMKEMLPSDKGLTLSPLNIGDSVVYDLNWKLANVYDTAELAVVSFVQDPVTHQIYQAGYGPPTPEQNDAGISALKVSPSFTCGSVAPVIALQNSGTAALTTCNINYQVDSAAPSVFPWSGNLASDSSVNVTLPAISTPGYHHLTVFTSEPNGGADPVWANDSSSTYFALGFATQPTPVTQDFESPVFPPAGWGLGSSSGITWQLDDSVGGFGTSGQSAVLNFSSIWYGNTDDLYAPMVDLSAATSAYCTFDVAYAQYNSSSEDTLKVNVSTDCGTAWSTVYSKSDTSLATAPDTTAIFVPTASQWRHETIDLSAYSGQENVQLQFHGISGYGNPVYVDNVNITSVTGIAMVAVDNSDMNIFPNPAQNVATITWQLNASNDGHILIYDLPGNEVIDLKADNSGHAEVDISGLSNGLYIVRLMSATGGVKGDAKLAILR